MFPVSSPTPSRREQPCKTHSVSLLRTVNSSCWPSEICHKDRLRATRHRGSYSASWTTGWNIELYDPGGPQANWQAIPAIRHY